MKNKAQESKGGFLRLPDVLDLIRVSKSTWWDGVRRGIYPPGCRLSGRCTGWRREDIERLLEELSSRRT